MEADETNDTRSTRSIAYIRAPGQSEVRWMGETSTHFLATGATTNGEFCLVEETAKRGESVPLHRHVDDVESFYVLDGEVTFFFDAQPGVRVGASSFVHLPGGVIHGFRVESDTARYLIITTAHHGEFYRAISIPAQANGRPATYEVDGDKVAAAIQDYGIDYIGDLPDQ
ncbi:MAG TPA: cupin domain-containing protein [Burkholderiales bacterium]|nr:cupin domain-containing protein [Burkholderiales bacterium]